MENEQKKKRYYRRTIDLMFLFVLLIVYIYAFYKAFNFSMLPDKYVFMALMVAAVIYLILFVLALQRYPTWFVVIKRIFIVLLCALFGTVGFFLRKVESTTEKIATVNSTAQTKLFILTRADSNIDSIEDLQGAVIGYQNGSDVASATYMKNLIENEVSGTQAYDYLDYTSLYSFLTNGQIDALAISEQYYGMTKATQEGFDEKVKTIHTFEKEAEQVENKIDVTEDVFTVYISGIDDAGSPDQMARTDVNLLMIVNPKNNHVDMVSLPRDGYIPNPALNGFNDKLTHTSLHGIQNSITSIEDFVGIPIDYYARISFTSVAQIVDAVGGIDIDVELSVCSYDESQNRTHDELESHEGQEVVCAQQGENQHLNGAQALVYARHRKTEGYGTEGRERAQRRVIMGVINKLLSLNALTYINNLLEVAPNFIITNMPSDQITSFINHQLSDFKPWTIHSLISDSGINDRQQVASLSTENGPYDVYLFSQEEIHEIMNAYDGAKKLMQLKDFSFDLDNLYENTPAISDDPNLVWSSMSGVVY